MQLCCPGVLFITLLSLFHTLFFVSIWDIKFIGPVNKDTVSWNRFSIISDGFFCNFFCYNGSFLNKDAVSDHPAGR